MHILESVRGTTAEPPVELASVSLDRDAISAASGLSKWLVHVYRRGDLFEKRRRLIAEWATRRAASGRDKQISRLLSRKSVWGLGCRPMPPRRGPTGSRWKYRHGADRDSALACRRRSSGNNSRLSRQSALRKPARTPSACARAATIRACRRQRRALLMCSNAPASSLPCINSAR
jgi:hypothetical protein